MNHTLGLTGTKLIPREDHLYSTIELKISRKFNIKHGQTTNDHDHDDDNISPHEQTCLYNDSVPRHVLCVPSLRHKHVQNLLLRFVVEDEIRLVVEQEILNYVGGLLEGVNYENEHDYVGIKVLASLEIRYLEVDAMAAKATKECESDESSKVKYNNKLKDKFLSLLSRWFARCH